MDEFITRVSKVSRISEPVVKRVLEYFVLQFISDSKYSKTIDNEGFLEFDIPSIGKIIVNIEKEESYYKFIPYKSLVNKINNTSDPLENDLTIFVLEDLRQFYLTKIEEYENLPLDK